jgi:plasmid stabilization system protein ParE
MHRLECEISENARLDLIVQYGGYVKKAGVEIAERYLESFKSTTQLLCTQPEMGMERKFRSSQLKHLRSFRLASPFGVHLLFYRIEGEDLVVFRVLHGMRDLPRRLVTSSVSD